MPGLTWKLIALLTLIFAVVVFLWFIFLGPLSRCDRLINAYAIASTAGHDAYGGYHRIFDLMKREGCMKGTEWVKDD